MIEVILLGIALSMDALAVSIANGIKYSNYGRKEMFLSSLSFGVFQGLMPLLGYLVFLPFISYVEKIDHWLVFIILGYIGFGMIKDSFEKDDLSESGEMFSFKILMAESVATAIDALSVGIALPALPLNPYLSCLVICMCTFIICLIGHGLGKQLGMLLKNKALALGGIILILIGLKTLIEHLGIL
ncbi:MAG: manganese efflux pump [Erysipelotrichaceae bacterium]|nr:manganese efflux pump [Erysipelotrichaceae bacterium]